MRLSHAQIIICCIMKEHLHAQGQLYRLALLVNYPLSLSLHWCQQCLDLATHKSEHTSVRNSRWSSRINAHRNMQQSVGSSGTKAWRSICTRTSLLGLPTFALVWAFMLKDVTQTGRKGRFLSEAFAWQCTDVKPKMRSDVSPCEHHLRKGATKAAAPLHTSVAPKY